MNIVLRNLLEITSLFLFSLIIFTWGLAGTEVIGFESRFYLFALEMWRNGLSLFPTAYQQAYPDYPATSTFFIYLIAFVMGYLDKWVAVMPSAIAAAATVVVTYLIGATQQKRWGVFAVLMLLCTFTFFKSARSIELDMYIVFITTTCFYLIYSADVTQKRSDWIYPLLILGFAIRGPIGLIIPTSVISAYYLVDGQIKKLMTTGLIALLLLLGCMVILLYLAHLTGGKTFMQEVLRMQVLGRIDNSYQPIYFYFTNSFKNYALSFPVAMLVFAGIWKVKNQREKKFLLKLLAWIFIIMLGMSVPGDKKIRYILPIVPACALLAAYVFMQQQTVYFKCLNRIVLGIFLFLPAILLAVITWCWYSQNDLSLFLHPWHFIFLLGMTIINFMIFFTLKKWLREISIVVIATLSFIVMNVGLIEPIERQIESARDLVQQVEMFRAQKNAQLVFYKEKPDGLPIKYLINASSHENLHPIFIEKESELVQFNQAAIFITSETYYDELPKQISKKFLIFTRKKLAHIPVVVFTKRSQANE